MKRIETLAKSVLILWFIMAMYLQHNVGLADNGDFTRSIAWISSGPTEIEPNWPTPGTEDWSRRFFNYWIPNWKLELNIKRPTSSAFFLWLPGVLLNSFLYSNKVLYLPILSLFPKLILFAVLLLLFDWIKLTRPFLIVSLGVPLTLVLTTTDYVAYLNSFYQESASFVFLFLLFILLLLLKQRPSFTYLLCGLASILLLATARPANLYWPLLAIPFMIYEWSFKKDFRLRTIVIANLTLILLFTAVSAFITKAGSMQANPYNSLFYGALTFSDNPSAHLRDLGMDNAAQCINTFPYSSIGSECFLKYQNRLSLQNTVRVIYREPAIMIRMLQHVLDNMQDISLEYLGKYSFDDPRSKALPPTSNSTENRFWLSTTETTWLNLWAKLKFTFFPTGDTLFFVLIGFVIWFLVNLKSTGVRQDLAPVGLMFTIACVADMTVAILGDGKYELIKHLFLSNLLFDIAAIIFLNSVLVSCIELIIRRFTQFSRDLISD